MFSNFVQYIYSSFLCTSIETLAVVLSLREYNCSIYMFLDKPKLDVDETKMVLVHTMYTYTMNSTLLRYTVPAVGNLKLIV